MESQQMDNFGYNYVNVGSNPSNRLDYVKEDAADDSNPLNVGDIKDGQEDLAPESSH